MPAPAPKGEYPGTTAQTGTYPGPADDVSQGVFPGKAMQGSYPQRGGTGQATFPTRAVEES